MPSVKLKIWKGVAPFKVKVFGWLAGLEKILTIDNLRVCHMSMLVPCA